HLLSAKNSWRLVLAHFDHCLRGRTSNLDAQFVGKVAAGLRLTFITEQGDVLGFAKSNRLSVEMAARELRHEFLARSAKRFRIDHIALAHHADDQLELFFLRL